MHQATACRPLTQPFRFRLTPGTGDTLRDILPARPGAELQTCRGSGSGAGDGPTVPTVPTLPVWHTDTPQGARGVGVLALWGEAELKDSIFPPLGSCGGVCAARY